MAAGSHHSAAVTSSGELFTWGLGEYGRLGHGDTQSQFLPKRVLNIIFATSINYIPLKP